MSSLECCTSVVCRERAVDGDSDSSSVSFDSDADFELDFERVPEQARAKVLPTHT